MTVAGTTVTLRDVQVRDVTRIGFASYGTLIEASTDRTPFAPTDAQLDLTHGTPRYYVMRIPGRGLVVDRITRHRRVTQALASVGGADRVVAVAPQIGLDDASAEPALADVAAFRIPGDVAVMLHKSTWHAGPLFAGPPRCFFNLELADSNEIDHHTCMLVARYGIALNLLA
jgi:ureidoglycolate hydrolase